MHEETSKCFCQIPECDLKKWAIKRYKENRSTLELLQLTDDPHDREVISIVALLDVDETALLEMMGNVDLPDHHILHCREKVKKMISEEMKGLGNV